MTMLIYLYRHVWRRGHRRRAGGRGCGGRLFERGGGGHFGVWGCDAAPGGGRYIRILCDVINMKLDNLAIWPRPTSGGILLKSGYEIDFIVHIFPLGCTLLCVLFYIVGIKLINLAF